MSADPYRPDMYPPPPPGPRHSSFGPAPYAPQPYQPPGPGYQMHPYSWPAPATVDGFVLVQPRLKPIPSGPAIGSLVAGIGGVLGALPGLILAALSPWAGLTFFMMSALLGVGSLLLAVHARRQIRAAAGGVSGKGVATTGLVLGITAASLAAVIGLIALASL